MSQVNVPVTMPENEKSLLHTVLPGPLMSFPDNFLVDFFLNKN